MAQLGLVGYFDAVISSALTGHEKPHERAYATARAALPDCNDLWMVGDSLEADVLGPERHGIHGVLVWRHGAAPPRQAPRHALDLESAVDVILRLRYRVTGQWCT